MADTSTDGDLDAVYDLHTLVRAPLTTQSGPLGAIVLGWDTPDAVSPTDLLTVATIAGFAAQAVTRARRLGHRTAVVREMQKAMLTTRALPYAR